MTDFVFPSPPQASLAVVETHARFPIRRVFCVGRNYAAHAREMGKDPDREPPFFFMKPADAVCDAGMVPYPPQTSDLHHEIELVLALGSGGSNLSEKEALACVWGAGVGIDLTRRDLQAQAKKMGRPWEWGKAFDMSAPIGPLVPLAQVPSLQTGRIWLQANGEMRQSADISDLIWSVAEIISVLSESMAVSAGDLVMTGTPAGVAACHPGDVLRGGVDGIGEIEVRIT
jgi:fumarylpyruvate hydrolase